ncbi:MAG: heme-copper oxidase subunit III [Acidimicrobiia bacterium]|nr:heme-copper oxidase subunit III [Acidimicrobiia bacterium]MDH5420938.1 heme-copper oxidase subunit III [Acidimicrobiia bacterium]MDH5505260.1 heme-copper oxidase subunit III [Acidimicrobiia bacterium]
MADIAHADGHHDVHESTGIDNRKLGMWVFLSSEFMFFGALISNYMLFKGRDYSAFVPAGQSVILPRELYDIPFTSVSSFVLLMSSLTMVLAHDALVSGDQNRTRIWLAATGLLGSVFIGGQVFEFTEFVQQGMTLSTNPAASAFFVLTGFHGAHVFLGILMLLSLYGISRRQGGLTESQGLNVELVGLYWHFVDIIWIVIFTIVYLIP